MNSLLLLNKRDAAGERQLELILINPTKNREQNAGGVICNPYLFFGAAKMAYYANAFAVATYFWDIPTYLVRRHPYKRAV